MSAQKLISQGARIRFASLDGEGPMHNRKGTVRSLNGLPRNPVVVIFDGDENVSYCAHSFLVPIDQNGNDIACQA